MRCGHIDSSYQTGQYRAIKLPALTSSKAEDIKFTMHWSCQAYEYEDAEMQLPRKYIAAYQARSEGLVASVSLLVRLWTSSGVSLPISSSALSSRRS